MTASSAEQPSSTRSTSRLAVVLVAVAAFVALVVFIVNSGGDSATSLPAVDLVDASGQVVSTESFRDEPTVINFWFSTCVPCARELVDFAEVHADRGDEVRFVGVNPLDTTERMLEFAGERGVTYDLYRDELAELQTELGLTSFPVTLFVDSRGEIVSQVGVIDAASLDAGIDELVLADQR
jgi:thiol-disulfide isomerase/thioredoxin